MKKTTIKELAERFEVSKRTIMRDLDAISSLGVPLYTQSGYQGGVAITDMYKIQQSFFSPQEIEDLILALHVIERLRKTDTKSSILKKLELLVPELAYSKEYDYFEYLKVELFEEPLIVNETIFRNINTALDEEHFLEIKIGNQDFCIAPLSYALRSNGLYLYATDGKQKLTFLISDILQCKVTEQEFERDEYQELLKS